MGSRAIAPEKNCPRIIGKITPRTIAPLTIAPEEIGPREIDPTT